MKKFAVSFKMPCGKQDNIVLSGFSDEGVREEFTKLFGDGYKIVEVKEK